MHLWRRTESGDSRPQGEKLSWPTIHSRSMKILLLPSRAHVVFDWASMWRCKVVEFSLSCSVWCSCEKQKYSTKRLLVSYLPFVPRRQQYALPKLKTEVTSDVNILIVDDSSAVELFPCGTCKVNGQSAGTNDNFLLLFFSSQFCIILFDFSCLFPYFPSSATIVSALQLQSSNCFLSPTEIQMLRASMHGDQSYNNVQCLFRWIVNTPCFHVMWIFWYLSRIRCAHDGICIMEVQSDPEVSHRLYWCFSQICQNCSVHATFQQLIEYFTVK